MGICDVGTMINSSGSRFAPDSIFARDSGTPFLIKSDWWRRAKRVPISIDLKVWSV